MIYRSRSPLSFIYALGEIEMRNLVLLSMVLLAPSFVTTLESKCCADDASVVSQSSPAGARGQTVGWSVKVTANGVSLPSKTIVFTWTSDFRKTPQAISSTTTDANGIAKMTFRIPTDARDDNVILNAKLQQTGVGIQFFGERDIRIAISR